MARSSSPAPTRSCTSCNSTSESRTVMQAEALEGYAMAERAQTVGWSVAGGHASAGRRRTPPGWRTLPSLTRWPICTSRVPGALLHRADARAAVPAHASDQPTVCARPVSPCHVRRVARRVRLATCSRSYAACKRLADCLVGRRRLSVAATQWRAQVLRCYNKPSRQRGQGSPMNGAVSQRRSLKRARPQSAGLFIAARNRSPNAGLAHR